MNLAAVWEELEEGDQVVWLDFQDWTEKTLYPSLFWENRKSQKYNKPPAREAPSCPDLQNSRTASPISHVSSTAPSKNTSTSSCFQSQRIRFLKRGLCIQTTYIYIYLSLYTHGWVVFLQILQSQQWFYLVWLFLKQTHITLMKCTSKCRGNHLETIRLLYGERF